MLRHLRPAGARSSPQTRSGKPPVPWWTALGRWLMGSRLRQGVVLGLVGAMLMVQASTFRWTDGLERGTLNGMFQMRGMIPPSPNIVLVVADESTVARFGQWPLPRRVYAEIVRHLHDGGAKTIAFDVQFPVPSERPKEDEEFIQACRRAGNVLQAAVFSPQSAAEISMYPAKSRELVQRARRFRITDQSHANADAVAGTAPIPGLLDSAPYIGHVTVYPEWNGSLLRIPHFIRYHEDSYPSLALAAAGHYLGVRPSDIIATNEYISIAGRHIPIDERGETLVNWTGPSNNIPAYTFQQVLATKPEEKLPEETFRNAVVLIGITHPGAYERYATPFSPNQPAVELQANALDNILENRPLREAPPSLTLILLFGGSLLSGIFTAWQGARRGSLWILFLAGSLWLTGFLLMKNAMLYTDVMVPILGVFISCGITLGYRQLTDSRDLKVAEERFALAAQGANDGIWDWDLKTNTIHYSPRWVTMLGYGDISMKPDLGEWMKKVHSDDIAKLQADIARHIDGYSSHFENEHRILHGDGTYRWVLARGIRVADSRGEPARMAGSLTDITDRKVAEETLLHNAFYDGLTGLPNRALFMDRLGRAIGRARRHPEYLFAVLFLDVDRFKNINDSLGHLIGDQLLISVARRLESCLRPGDTAARLGGDEFTMLLDDIHDEQDAIRVAERFQSELARPLVLDGHEVFPAASIGIALSRQKGETSGTQYERPDDLLRDADTAMYRAKASGRGRHEVFDVGMHARAVALLRLETDLRRALERGQFHAFFQPIISLQSGSIAGFEALARWEHPERGMVPPVEFIALAEETGLVLNLDHEILAQSCRQIRLWNSQFGSDNGPALSLSANLSGKHFAQGGLAQHVERVLRETHLPAHCLRLEITESVILENIDSATRLLNELKALGVQLALDDFGTGYSSLSYLHRLPFDILKVDRSFVSRLGEHGENIEIVRAIVTLARNMNIAVIAEGIETSTQLALLKELECDYGQGFFFSRPLSADETATLLMEDRAWRTLNHPDEDENSNNGLAADKILRTDKI